MADRPVDPVTGDPIYPRWAVNTVTNSQGAPNKVVPDTGLVNNGFDPVNEPRSNHMNYQFELIDRWIEYADESINDTLDAVYPVGSIYISTVSTPPSFGTGTWQAFGQGRMLIGAGTGTDSNGENRTFAGAEEGGNYDETLDITQIPSHNHTTYVGGRFERNGGSTGLIAPGVTSPDSGSDTDSNPTGAGTAAVGGNQSHNNMPPYISTYMWVRIS